LLNAGGCCEAHPTSAPNELGGETEVCEDSLCLAG
jgi:hypothetical protein